MIRNLFLATPWLSEEEEGEVVTKFLTDENMVGLSVDLMRFFLDTLHELEAGGQQRIIIRQEFSPARCQDEETRTL